MIIYDKRTDTEVMSHAMLIGLALGKLGLMLFGNVYDSPELLEDKK